MTWKKGYVNAKVCEDGEDTHNFEETTMSEEGTNIQIRHCTKCGYWD